MQQTPPVSTSSSHMYVSEKALMKILDLTTSDHVAWFIILTYLLENCSLLGLDLLLLGVALLLLRHLCGALLLLLLHVLVQALHVGLPLLLPLLELGLHLRLEPPAA